MSAEADNPLAGARRMVVKIGSSLVIDQHGEPRLAWLGGLARDIAASRKEGIEVILVSSGAVALGRAVLGLAPGKRMKLEEKQAAAAAGQARLMAVFESVFSPCQIAVAQALLTSADTEARRRWLNARATLKTLLEHRILPIVNENDTVATEEIRYGDNDRLAARVAQMTGADILILLSDIDGLYSADPRRDSNARHIDHVAIIGPDIVKMAQGSGSVHGSGGMITKLEAARIATGAGCMAIIASGHTEAPLQQLADGGRSTRFLASATPQAARRQWLAGALNPCGTVTIDDGAVNALLAGKSLLHVGVIAVSGRFERGDAIAVHGPDDNLLGCGISAYAAGDALKLLGKNSARIEEILGYAGRPALIHRDDLALLESHTIPKEKSHA